MRIRSHLLKRAAALLAAAVIPALGAIAAAAPAHAAGPALSIDKQICLNTMIERCSNVIASNWASTATIPAGQPVFYLITIKNLSAGPVTSVKVTDLKAPTCALDFGNGSSIKQGDSSIYICKSAPAANTTAVTAVTGAATVQARTIPGAPIGTAASPATTAVHMPASVTDFGPAGKITLTADTCINTLIGQCALADDSAHAATATIPHGYKAQFRVKIANIGVTTTTGATITATASAACEAIAPFTLAPGATKVVRCASTTNPGTAGITNVVQAKGASAGAPIASNAASSQAFTLAA